MTVVAAPPVPNIAASGTLALTIANPDVTLTSDPATSYLWTNGATTQSITVNIAGTYRVTVTGAGGCTSTSGNTVVTSTACTPPAVPIFH